MTKYRRPGRQIKTEQRRAKIENRNNLFKVFKAFSDFSDKHGFEWKPFTKPDIESDYRNLLLIKNKLFL